MTSLYSVLARRLLVYTIIMTLIVACVIASIQLYMDYKKEMRQLHLSLMQVETSFLSTIGESVWTFDQKLLETVIEGVVSLPYVVYAEVKVEHWKTFSFGRKDYSDLEVKTYQINFPQNSHKENIGTLRVMADKGAILANLKDKAFFIISVQSIQTFIISALVFILFYSLVTRHIVRLVMLTREKIESPNFHFSLNKKSENGDELDELVAALNTMVKELKETQDKIMQTNEDLEYFTHIAAHDLREPVQRIANLLELAEYTDREDAVNLHRRCRTACNEMAQMLDDFRAFTKLGYGKMLREDINFEEFILDVVKEFSESQFKYELINLPKEINAYPNLMKVLFRNIVQNALKYSRDPVPTIKFMCEQRYGKNILSIWNSGSSIDSDKLLEVFKPFRRYSKESGTGIGMSICKRIVERHGGEIWVESGGDWVKVSFFI